MGTKRLCSMTQPPCTGALTLRFSRKDVREKKHVRALIAHPGWNEYLIAKAAELASGMTAKKKAKRNK